MTIFIHAYRSFSIRYILGTDIFKTLKSSGNRIVIFVKDEEVDHFKNVLQDKQIVIEPVLYYQSRDLMRRNLWIRSLNLLRIMTAGGKSGFLNNTIKMRRIQYKKEFNTPKSKLLFRVLVILSRVTSLSNIARILLNKLMAYTVNGKLYDHFFNNYQPSLVIISSLGYGIDIPFMNSAKRNDCKIISIPHSWDNPSTKGYRGVKPDKVITWNKTNAKEVEIFHDINPKHIFAGGIAHWDQYFKGEAISGDRFSFCQKHSLDPEKKILFYALSGPRHYERRFDVIRGILETISSGQVTYPSQLLVRFHPIYIEEDVNGESLLDHNKSILTEIALEYGDLVRFWFPKRPHMNQNDSLSMSDMLDMANAMRISDVIIQEYSTLILESTIFNTPLINMSIYYYGNLMHFTHLKHVFKYQSLRNVRTFKEFSDITNQYLSNPALDQEQREKLFKNEVDINPGSAGTSIGNYILEQLN